jgi:hypothetical protein
MNGRSRAGWLGAGLVGAMLIAAPIAGPIAAASGASGPPKVVLAGFTSQNYPSFAKISADGRTLEVGAIALDVKCTSGIERIVPDEFVRVPIRANGSMHTTFMSPATAGPNGTTYRGTDSLTARLGPRRTELTGTWRLQLQFTGPGGESMHCDSGIVRFADST